MSNEKIVLVEENGKEHEILAIETRAGHWDQFLADLRRTHIGQKFRITERGVILELTVTDVILDE